MTTRADLTAIIGEAGVDALIAWRPGSRFRVPKTAALIAPIIGDCAAAALCSALPWKVLYIPERTRKKCGRRRGTQPRPDPPLRK